MNDEDKKLKELTDADFDEIFSDTDEDIAELMNELETIVLNDEDGIETEFEFIDLISYEGEDYVVLLPVERGESGEVVILRLEESENEDKESYVSVDDEAILMAVFNIFKEKFKDSFNFID